jgi:hypothetical protein
VAILYNPPRIFELFYAVSLINAWYWSNNIKHLLIFLVKVGYVYSTAATLTPSRAYFAFFTTLH